MNGHASINKSFRLVWSAARGSYITAPETAKGRGKSRRSSLSACRAWLSALVFPFAMVPLSSLSQTVVEIADGATSSLVAPNGVSVVNISNPNGAGLSHNRFNRYDVGTEGLVLNNSMATVQSQLAGRIAGNPNLTASAQVILNEVVSNNRSVLAGFTEVAGSKAAVIVANPNGITCNGCGFINTDRVTLTTGTPVFDNERLSRFSVVGGDVLIGGDGLNATAQEMLDIVTRSVTINGNINTSDGGSLDIVTGANEWDYEGRMVTGSATAIDASPSFAIDSTVLGGMYAGQIRLVATEAGLGVRMLGEAAARASDFTLTATGQVEITNAKISAEGDLQLTTSSTSTNALVLEDASLSAKGDLSLNATGGAMLNGGVLLATENLLGSFGTLTDSTSSATLNDNNARYGEAVALNISGVASFNGTSWGADNDLTITAGSLSADDSALLYAGTNLNLTATIGDVDFIDARANANNNTTIAANSGLVVFSADSGLVSANGNIDIIAGNGLDQAGVLSADKGSVSIQADGVLINSGTVNAFNALNVSSKTQAEASSLINLGSGRLLSGGEHKINLHAFDNQGVVESAGALDITVDSLLNSGTLLTYGDNQGSLSLFVATLDNSGAIGSAGALSLTSSSTVGTGDSVTNTGTIQSDGNMTLSVGRQMTNAYEGKILSGSELTLTSNAGLFNTTTAGIVQSTGAMRLGEESHKINLHIPTPELGVEDEGHRIISDDTLTINANSVTSSAGTNSQRAVPQFQARKGISIDVNDWGVGGNFNIVASTEHEGDFKNYIKVWDQVSNGASNSRLRIASYGDFSLEAEGLNLGLYGIQSGAGSIFVRAGDFENQTTGFIDAALDFNVSLKNSRWLNSVRAGRDILINVDHGGAVQLTNAQALRDIIINTDGEFFNFRHFGLVEAGRHLAIGEEGNFVRLTGTNRSAYLQSLGTMSIISDSPWSLMGTVKAHNGLIFKASSLNSQYRSVGQLIFSVNPGTDSSAYFSDHMTGTSALIARLHSAGDLNLFFQDLELIPYFEDNSSNNTAIFHVGSISSSGTLKINGNRITNHGGSIYGGTGLIIDAKDSFINEPGFRSVHTSRLIYLSLDDFNAGISIGPEVPPSELGCSIDTQSRFRCYFAPDLQSGGFLYITARGQSGSQYGFINRFNTGLRAIPAQILAMSDIIIDTTRFHNSSNASIISILGDINIKFTEPPASSSLGHNAQSLSSSTQGDTPAGVISAAGELTINSDIAFDNKGILRATKITGTGSGGLVNSGNPMGGAITPSSASGGNPPPGPTTVSATTPLSAVTPQVLTPGGTISFGGFSVTLPSKPNSFFVISRDPTSRFLVETNPLFTSDVTIGSDYLMSGLGLGFGAGQTPSTQLSQILRRLGDDNYEAYLIRQQLIQETGSNVLRGYGNENNQIRRLMDQAISQSSQLGLVFGQALSPDQISGLTQDIVWMETINIGGEAVLVPRVYLAQSTRDMITGGATIMAETINLEGSLTNQGGTITSSDEDLVVTAGGDIINQGGTIGAEGDVSITSAGGDIANRGGTIRSGGDMSLTASEGSISNETETQTDRRGNTTIVGATGSIEAGGNLSMDASIDITVRGADVSAGGNANLIAGENITFDTIVETSTTRGRDDTGANVTTRSVTHTGSNLNVGGNLNLISGADTTLAGSAANVGGNLTATTGGDLNVISRQDTLEVQTSTSSFGVGVGGGLFGATSTQTNDFTGTNVGSTLNVGGNADLNSSDRVIIQGSEVNIDGDANITATQGIEILDGQDERRTTTRTTTTTLFSYDTNNSAGSSSESQSGGANRAASASAGAEAHAEAGADLNLLQVTTTRTTTTELTSVGSSLNVGGNLNLDTQGDVTVQGSVVSAGGDLSIDAENVNVLTGRNESTTETTTNTLSVGVFTESSANAEASAGAQSQARGPVGTTAGAEAAANAGAEATVTFGVRTTASRETSATVTNTSASLTSGGDMDIRARDTATFQGANVSSGGDMNIEATNIRNLAAQDTTLETSSSTSNMAGIFFGASAGAEASAEANASAHQEAGGDAGGQASVGVSSGVRFLNTQENSVSGSVTQVTNTFSAGGNLNRTAQDTIVDQGTQAEAGGNISQSARVIRDEAVSDSTFSSSNSQTHDARIAITASAEAKAGNGEAPDVSKGVAGNATYEGEISSASEMETTAVTSRFRAGGNIDSISTEETTLVGTQFEAGGDVNLEAGTLEFRAAADTSRSSETTHSVSAEISISADEVGAQAGYSLSTANSESSTARTGGIVAGGNVNITTRGDASFEGTNLSSGGDTNIDIGGNLEMSAARDTSSSSATNLSVQAELGASRENSDQKSKAEAELSFEAANTNQAQVGSISSQGNLVIRSGGNTTLEGTQISAEGTAQVQAGGAVILQEAVSTISEVGISVKASAESERKTPEKTEGADESKDGDTAAVPTTTQQNEGQFSAGVFNESTSIRANIQGGGGVSIQSNVPIERGQ